MCHVYPKLYRKCIIINKRGKLVIYVKILKALYKLLQSALIFYPKLVKDLQKYGLKMNPYDTFFNSMNNGENLTAIFHVNNLKVSHMDPFNLMLFVYNLYRIYGNKLVVHQGKVHDYLRINDDLSE